MFDKPKINMIKQQIRTWGQIDEHILSLFYRVDRARFLPPALADLAYADMALPMLHGEYMLSPALQAKMLQALKVQKHETVLEVGTGNGFLTALLAHLAQHVISVEIHRDLSLQAQAHLANEASCQNVACHVGHAAAGWKLNAPVDVLFMTGSVPFLPLAFQACIKPEGRILAILGRGPAMQVTLIQRVNQAWVAQPLFETHVPPLLRAAEQDHFVF